MNDIGITISTEFDLQVSQAIRAAGFFVGVGVKREHGFGEGYSWGSPIAVGSDGTALCVYLTLDSQGKLGFTITYYEVKWLILSPKAYQVTLRTAEPSLELLEKALGMVHDPANRRSALDPTILVS